MIMPVLALGAHTLNRQSPNARILVSNALFLTDLPSVPDLSNYAFSVQRLLDSGAFEDTANLPSPPAAVISGPPT